ncbi:MAG: HigA family addiction module antitoxin [Candidatus Acidiferrales bacterium]
MNGTDYKTPGQLIQALLDARGWTQRVLAIVLGIDETGLNKIVAGKRPIDADLALNLSQVFDVPAERFLELQKTYDLAMARLISSPDPGLSTRASLFGDLPVSDIIKRGWLVGVDDVRQVRAVEDGLCKFFGASSVDEIEILPHAAKKTNVFAPATAAQIAWLYRVKQIAEQTLVAKYSREALLGTIEKFRGFLGSPEGTRKVPRLLTECGVRFVIVESLPSAKIDGVCLWLNERAPVIGMSLRHDRIDNFWFVLRHECEHVLQNHGRAAAMLDTELEKERAGTGNSLPEEERVANEAAAEFCVPQSSLQKFIERKSPFFAERDVIGFARTFHLHPGIVAGQLQHKTARYELFRGHLAKVRSLIAPNAMIDGWGDVAPVDL